jgi:hypothetical protein
MRFDLVLLLDALHVRQRLEEDERSERPYLLFRLGPKSPLKAG